MKKEEEIKFNKWFRRAALIILFIEIFTIPIVFCLKKISYDNYLGLVATLGSDAEEVQNYEMFDLPNSIYRINSVLCVISIILQIVYFSVKRFKFGNKKEKIRERIVKNWPCLLLALFMAWTSVGCIQAGMEMDAEIYVKSAKNIEDVPQRLIDIANWSSGDRMSNTSNIYQNAKDRAWHGCDNLKDGYFSFMFYATILLNILMLGDESEKYKYWILRALLVSSLFLGVFVVLSFYRPIIVQGVCYYRRAIFNNSNHFGYYITVVLIMSLVMWLREKNYYFKGLNFINCILYIPILIINNTFGAYLGVLCAFVFLFIVEIIRLVKNRKVSEFVEYIVVAIIFAIFSNMISSVSSNNYSRNYNYFSYSILNLNIGNSTYSLSFNSISDDDAKELGIDNTTVSGAQVKWGTKLVKLEDKKNTIVQNNFNGLIRDIKTLTGFVEDTKSETNSSGEKKIPISSEELNNKLAQISEKYPKVSGESLEEFNKRQDTIQEEINLILSKYEVTEKPTTDSKSGLTEEVSSIGSGRGETWIKVLDLVNQRPWFGWGLENLLNEFYQQYGISEGRTHNLVLQLAGTTGIPGVALYLIGTISLFLKVLFDAKFRKYSRNQLLIIFGIMLVAAIGTSLIVSHFTDKLLFIWSAIIIVEALVVIIAFTEKVKLRISAWNEFEQVGATVFVSYMISSLFGNSAFYTSPYFMIFLGILTYEAIHKKSLILDENSSEPMEIKNASVDIKTNTKDTLVENNLNNKSTKKKKKKGGK